MSVFCEGCEVEIQQLTAHKTGGYCMPCSFRIAEQKVREKKMKVTVDSFMQLVAESELAEHAEYIRSTIRPAVQIVRSRAQAKPGGSRLGGEPDLPDGLDWPRHDLDEEHARACGMSSRPYRFLGQFNLEDLGTACDQLPSRGLLSLFVQYDPEGELEFFWQDAGFVYAHYTLDVENLKRRSAPEPAESAQEMSVQLYPSFDIPYDEFQRSDWPFDFDEYEDEFAELRESLHDSGEYLLGYPSHNSLAYDPTPGEQWMSLLTLGSDDDWCWHDGDTLMVFIERARLAEGDFSALKSDAG